VDHARAAPGVEIARRDDHVTERTDQMTTRSQASVARQVLEV
jgi:hypothetical protein